MSESKQDKNVSMPETKNSPDEIQAKLKIANKFERGRVYYDNLRDREVEFGYVGGRGDAVCYRPGDSGGGMQSAFLVDPRDMTPTGRRFCKECGQEIR